MEPEKIAILGKRKLAYMLSLSGFLTKDTGNQRTTYY